MDWSALSWPALGWELFLDVFSIFIIDLVLAGDNAVVIALAVKSLPKRKRLLGIAFGAGFAVVLRILLTVFAAQLLQISYLKFIGGVLIFWIALKLLIQDIEAEETGREGTNIWNAIWIIMVADVTMSTDNILALAGASKGNLFLLLFGLGLSIPLVVFGSTLLSRLMDKYPIIIYLGAAVLGKVAVDLIFTDPVVEEIVRIPQTTLYILELLSAVLVVLIGRIYIKYQKSRTDEHENAAASAD
jgi:YjbE family integral membrane protein